MKSPHPDKRPRFGRIEDIDSNPQKIWEGFRKGDAETPVAVIPLPFMSPKIKAKVREFTKTLWPKS